LAAPFFVLIFFPAVIDSGIFPDQNHARRDAINSTSSEGRRRSSLHMKPVSTSRFPLLTTHRFALVNSFRGNFDVSINR
jgi:hypothetical protein